MTSIPNFSKHCFPILRPARSFVVRVVCASFVGVLLDAESAAEFESFIFYVLSKGRSGCSRCTQRMSPRASRPMFLDRSRMRLMAKTVPKRNIGTEVLEGLRELKRGEIGRVVSLPSVASIRERTGLSQAKFAALLGVSVRTLQEWEQGRRAPSGAARTLLMVAAKNPQALLEVA